jgi:beta-lactamase regulating signal transducer with metallopeptidase domain
MNSLHLNHPILLALGWSLAHFLWQGLLIAAGAKTVLAFLGSGKAEARYRACYFALLLSLACFCVTFAELQSGYLRPPMAQMAPPATPTVHGDQLGASEAGVAGVSDSPALTLPLALSLIAAGWLTMVLALSVHGFIGWLGLRNLKKNSVPIEAGPFPELLRKIAKEWRISRKVDLLQSVTIEVPITFGWLRPVVLIPASLLTQMSPAQLELALWHEMAHVRRHDYIFNLLQVGIETLFFFHPAIRWLGAEARREREHCCDDLALEGGNGQAAEYARMLTALEDFRTIPRFGLAIAEGNLLRRIRRITATAQSGASPWPLASLCAGMGLLASVFLGMARELKPALAAEKKAPTIEFRLVADEDEPKEPFEEFATEKGQKLKVFKKTLLDSSKLRSAQVKTNSLDGNPELELEFDKAGAKELAQITKDAIGKKLAIVSNGRLLSAPQIRSSIAGGKAVITGNFKAEELEEIAKKALKDRAGASAPAHGETEIKTAPKAAADGATIGKLRSELARAEEKLRLKEADLESMQSLGNSNSSLESARDRRDLALSLSAALQEATVSKLKLETTLDSIGNMNPRTLQTFLQSTYPNPVLESLLLAESQAKLDSNTARLRQINDQIANQVTDIVNGIKAQVQEKELVIRRLEDEKNRLKAQRLDAYQYDLEQQKRAVNELAKKLENAQGGNLEERLASARMKLSDLLKNYTQSHPKVVEQKEIISQLEAELKAVPAR